MSPIGRVFIVLNLILAGAFVGFAGTYLQKQDNEKKRAEESIAAHLADNKKHSASIEELKSQVNAKDASLASLTQEKDTIQNKLTLANEEKTRLEESKSKLEARIGTIDASLAGIQSATDAAMKGMKENGDKAFAAEAEKNTAIRDRDDAKAKLNDANAKIAELTEAGTKKDLELAQLAADNSANKLLVDVAKAKGFLPMMAVPNLAGTVTMADGNLVTINVSHNPDKANIAVGTLFAVHSGNAYKGEAKVTQVEGNNVFCTMQIKKGDVKVGDAASTTTN
jgi:hypothetical protein